MVRKSFALVLGLAILCAGCTPVEVAAYRTIAGAKGFTDSMRQSHPECAAGVASNICVKLAIAVHAKDVLIDAAEVYCAGPNFESGGACNPPTKKDVRNQLAAKFRSMLAIYKQAEGDVKGAAK